MKVAAVFIASIYFKDGSSLEHKSFMFHFNEEEKETRFSADDPEMKILNIILSDFLMCHFDYDCSGYGMIPLEDISANEKPFPLRGPLFAVAVEKIKYFTLEKILDFSLENA